MNLFFFLSSFALSAIIHQSNQQHLRNRKSYTLFTLPGKQFTLENAQPYTRKGHSIIKRIFSPKSIQQELEQKQWYYVHFLTDDLFEVQKYIKLTSSDQLIKNTFHLYLSGNEIETISSIALAKRVEPEDKIDEAGGSFENIELLHVVGANDLKLVNNEYYSVESKSDHSYIVRIDRKGLNDKQFTNKKKKAALLIAEIPAVKSVSTYKAPKIKNSAMTAFTQQNSATFTFDSDSQLYTAKRYLNDKGVTGEGEIITIQDTPIDVYHTMFLDGSNQVEINKTLQNHRKIIYYGYSGTLTNLQANIEENEHGTHVAGTAAGKSICSDAEDIKDSYLLNGNAPDAKILYVGGLNDVTYTKHEEIMNKHSSLISTNSWGYDGYYDNANYQWGTVAYRNPQSIFLFAAGNEYEEKGNFSVCDPGGSKNVLTVGAIDDFYSESKSSIFQSIVNPQIKVTAQCLLPSDPWAVGPIGTTANTGAKIVAVNVDGTTSQCPLINAPHITLLYNQNQAYPADWIYSCTIGASLGIFWASKSQYPQVSELIKTNGDVSVTDYTKYNLSKGIQHASYSSTGPANKGIMKPDVMGPGTSIISAKSRPGSKVRHGCRSTQSGSDYVESEEDFTSMQGTSMATPNIAGATALVRHYFRKFWPYESVNLNGATTRALLINSCVHPTNSKQPDIMFGHGVVDLSTVLPFDNNFGVQITSQTNPPTVEDGGHVIAKFTVSSSNVKVQVTLSYLDKMLERDSAVPLTRDLDLVVSDKCSQVFTGDHLDEDTQHLSTNEKIIINTNEVCPGEYTIHIYGNSFADGGLEDAEDQAFSVVVTGDVENKYLEFYNPDTVAPTPTPIPPPPTPTPLPDDKPPEQTPLATPLRTARATRTPLPTVSNETPIPEVPDPTIIPPTTTPFPSRTEYYSGPRPTPSPLPGTNLLPSCPCPECDPVNPSVCKCNESRIGATCQTSINLSNSAKKTFTVEAQEIKRVMFYYSSEIKRVKAVAGRPLLDYIFGDDSTIFANQQKLNSRPRMRKLNDPRALWFWDSNSSIGEVTRSTVSLFDFSSSKARLYVDTECKLSLSEYAFAGETGAFFNSNTNIDFGTNAVCVAVFNNNYEAGEYTIEVTDKKALSAGAIAGIVVGCVAAIGAVVGGVVMYKKGVCACKSQVGGA